MSVKQMRAGIPQLFKGGTKHAVGLEATVRKNIEACVELSKITRTSLGPNGMNKMVINHLDKLFVTSDAATIMREMEIAHPAAKMIVMASDMQEQEVGDGSNFVVVFAGQLMHQAEGLLDMGLHPSEILNGYELAAKKVQELIQNLAVFTAEHKDMFNKDTLTKGIKTCIAAKQYGNENFLAPLVAEACLAVMPKNPANFLVDNVRVVKLLGGSVLQSELVRGMVVPHNTVGSISKLTDAKVAVFTCGVEPSSTETKGTVLLENAEELMSYNDTEEKNLQALIKSIRDTGVNCIVCSGTVTDMAKHFLDKYGIMCVKLSSQHDIRRMARAVKATPLVALQPPSQEEIGFCSSISTREMGLQNILVFSQASADATQIATIVLRGSTHNVLNDIERAVDDGVNIVRMMGRDGRFLAGGGANDIELARQLASFADARAGLEQYAVRAYAEALEVMPRILAENAGLVALDVVSQLYAEHEKGNTSHGVNIEDGGLRDVTAENILDHLATKASGLRLASNAVVTILRVDQIIQSKPAGGPKAPSNQGHWDDD